MLSIVMKAYWILGEPSKSAKENYLEGRDSKMVGKRVVFNLQMCEIDTAADVLKGSFLVVW
jgi:hypothetical protein